MTDEEMERQKQEKPVPERQKKDKQPPKHTDVVKELPPTINPENTITVGEDTIEIKPTRIKFQRDRTATFYRVLEIYPLPDILSAPKGAFDKDRDGDMCVFDWCIAATDDEKFVTRHYNDMTTETIERLLSIFKRLNKIDDKEEKIKNMEAKETKP